MKLALCIGINDYPGTENDLAGCRNDAEDWAATLIARGFDTRCLLDSAATGTAIRAAIQSLLTTATAGDAVVITYSGHGTWVPDTSGDEPDHRDEALCPHDIAENGPLLDDDLHTLFAQAREGVRTVLISDSCHSGTLTRPHHPIGDHPTRPRFLPPATFLSKHPTGARSSSPAGSRPTALLLAGCTDTEYSYDATFNTRPNGAFTYVALATLATLPPTATYRTWLEAIRATLPSQDYPQTPTLSATRPQHSWPLLA
ncbi:caspase domain-containing protein [Dactylosporangium sp. NPDC051541]|uniref:caspase domain-containing protein n=1 Tax=Dactylosporangium sp. NPDC051541 TaxID=3363977 RepID=UPI0037A8D271